MHLGCQSESSLSTRHVRRKLFASESELDCPVSRSIAEEETARSSSNFVRVNMAGTVCTGWSAAGKGLHFADPSERPHAIWASERVARAEQGLEDFMISECTPRYPVQEKLSALENTHDVFSIVLSPMMLGWPVRRTRVFTCALNRETMAWFGPPASEISAHFMQFFERSVATTGDICLAANDAEVRAYLCEMARKRGFELPENVPLENVQLHHIYAPGQMVRLQSYEQDRQRHLAETVEVDHAAVGALSAVDAGPSAWFADLEQNLGQGASTPSEMLPSALTHGTLHAWSANRPVLPMEQFLAHGFNVFPDRSKWKRACLMTDALSDFSSCQQKKLLGNGWHLPVIASWMFYIMAHTVKLDRSVSIQPERTLLRKGGSSFSIGQGSSTPDLSLAADSQDASVQDE
ncbi:unnamed protein product [Symbiodinium natans]|uniref:Uncharacterized protein n=1 Tax=Symbiodinium natans TaxID=878477 RepID=A0A812H0P2_9DINO|nr:unnamed protein product [Symbiodinium natans]CAE7257009.1 unnamed protein product [Symbiodinium natans]